MPLSTPFTFLDFLFIMVAYVVPLALFIGFMILMLLAASAHKWGGVLIAAGIGLLTLTSPVFGAGMIGDITDFAFVTAAMAVCLFGGIGLIVAGMIVGVVRKIQSKRSRDSQAVGQVSALRRQTAA